MKSSIDEKPKGVEFQKNPDGTPNVKYIDLLDEDKSIAGQKFTCLSFLSPEKIIKQKEIFYFEQFIKQWDMSKSFEKYTQFLHFISYKYGVKFDDLSKDLQDFCTSEKDNIIAGSLHDEYKNYLDANEERLENKFNEACEFHTNVRGIKVRGSFPTQQEAELRCKMLREVDPHHDVFIGQVGIWMPFHPEAYKTGKVEYLEEELNQLMSEKKLNEEKATQEFDKRVRETKKKAIEENKKKAEESGNMLTQTINDEGELIGVNAINSVESNVDNDVAVADLRKELFEGDNIVIEKNSDHGIMEVINNKKKHDSDIMIQAALHGKIVRDEVSENKEDKDDN